MSSQADNTRKTNDPSAAAFAIIFGYAVGFAARFCFVVGFGAGVIATSSVVLIVKCCSGTDTPR